MDELGNVYVTGSIQATVDLDPDSGIEEANAYGMNDIFVQKLDAKGKLVWARRVGGRGNDYGRTIVADPVGNSYTIGSFSGRVDFDPGPGKAWLTAAGKDDVFVLKLDRVGNHVWAQRIGGTGSETGYSLAVDPAGNVYGAGYFSGTADFDPGPGVVQLRSRGGHDIFVTKLDAAGNFQWAKSMGSANHDWAISIAVDAAGDVYATGHFEMSVDFDPRGSAGRLTSFGEADVFVLKLNTHGDFAWVRQMGGPGHDQGRSIAVDEQKNVHVTGSFEETADFEPGKKGGRVSSAGSRDVFVQKLDFRGRNLWVTTIGGPQFMRGNSIAMDSSGNVYSTGRFKGAADFDPGPGVNRVTSRGNDEYYVQKLNPSGQLVWSLTAGAHLADHGHCIAVNGQGSVFATGTFQGTVDFDPGTGGFKLIGAGGNDVFVHKIK